MTIALEHIQEGDWAALNRVIDILRSLVFETGGQSLGIRIGATTVSTSAAVSASVAVNHGLGRTPARAFSNVVSDTSGVVNSNASGYTSTQITLAVQYVDGTARTFSNTVEWVVIG